jgi:hypothetical protein
MPSTTTARPGSVTAETTPSNRPRRTSPGEERFIPGTGAACGMSAVITERASHTITAEYASRRPCRVQ